MSGVGPLGHACLVNHCKLAPPCRALQKKTRRVIAISHGYLKVSRVLFCAYESLENHLAGRCRFREYMSSEPSEQHRVQLPPAMFFGLDGWVFLVVLIENHQTTWWFPAIRFLNLFFSSAFSLFSGRFHVTRSELFTFRGGSEERPDFQGAT